MKKIINSLGRAISFLTMLLIINSVISCSKGDKPAPNPTPVDLCPNLPGVQTDASLCPAIPAPIGTVTPSATNVSYDGTVTFSFSFQNDTAVYIGGNYVGKHTGTYTTGKLKKDSLFTISAKGLGGTSTLPSALISVGLDPRVNFITQGQANIDSTFVTDSASTTINWVSVPNGTMHNYVHVYQGFGQLPAGLSGSMGNPGTAFNGTVQLTFHWYFTGETGFDEGGVHYYRFDVTGSNTYDTYNYGPAIINGNLVTGMFRRKWKLL